MRLESAHISNFKLLEDVTLHFSCDLRRPLSVIRAENGSGKTSILYALRWGMYGDKGIPQMRLTSTAKPPGQPVHVQVRLDFTTNDPYSDTESHFRLIRTCQEIPQEGDNYVRDRERRRLLRRTERGEVEIDGELIDGLIAMLLPLSLADVFFTNGDDVQRFISSGQQGDDRRQEAVHKAIRQILGLSEVEEAERYLTSVTRKTKGELAGTGSEALQSALEKLNGIEDSIKEQEERLSSTSERILLISEHIQRDERELDNIKGIGDLEAIQARIHALEKDIEHSEQEEVLVRKQMKEYFRSEDITKHLAKDKLLVGLTKLSDLADWNVIPGTSIEVLKDRLHLGICICGEQIKKGDARHAHVQRLILEQEEVTPQLDRLTALWHEARNRIDSESVDSESFIADKVTSLREQFTQCRDRRRQKEVELNSEREKRGQIDEDRVNELTQRLQSSRGKLTQFHQDYGRIKGRIQQLEENRQLSEESVSDEERKADLSKMLRRRVSVASDLVKLTQGTLERLKSIYVRRVSSRMEELFLDIVGADPTADATVFTGVTINEEYDIVIQTLEGRTLDADTELNGASQRGLTLSFIWSLMEVAERRAPRIIDTPLGMTSGAVKQRMVETLTKPVESNGLPYQIVLFMTRSELRDIEPLITERAGVVTTLSCSKDYPKDLLNDWGEGIPAVRTCECNHTEVCIICERRNDADRFTLREV